MKATVVDVADVSKSFKIHYERHQSLKERLLHPRTGHSEDFSALANISFQMEEGETVRCV